MHNENVTKPILTFAKSAKAALVHAENAWKLHRLPNIGQLTKNFFLENHIFI